MTDREAIEAVREGRRAVVRHSLHASRTIDAACDHRWRVIVCTSYIDVIECARCGEQRLVGWEPADDPARGEDAHG